MPSLDDIPTLPPCTPTGDDLIAVIDGSDRRSPKRCSLDQVVALVPSSLGGNDIVDTGKLVQFGLSGDITASSQIRLYYGAFYGQFLPTDISANRALNLPDSNGSLALAPVIVAASPTTTFAITAARYTDQTHYLTPTGAVTGTFTLPTAANSRAGQIIRLWSTQAITSLTVNVSGSGTIQGTALTAGVANTPYAWQCVSTTGNGTWTRIQ